jgi:putative redox protein
MSFERVEFEGSQGHTLSARLDLPEGEPRTKDILAASHICTGLTKHSIAVLRFDFTGLGLSEGDFSNTNFSSSLGDLVAAAAWLREHRAAPALLIGHSLGGAAVLAAAHLIPECKAVASIAAPANPAHVAKNFAASCAAIEHTGEAEVVLGGKPFRIKRQFLDDIMGHAMEEYIHNLDRALIIFHSPTDAQVGIENASKISAAAKHPKSFISLDGADHLLRGNKDAHYVANVLASWVARYL